MVHQHNREVHQDDRDRSDMSNGWLRPARIALYFFLGIIAFFLITEHFAHLIPVLPWLFLLACPLMHLFMHGGHGGHGGGSDDRSR
ncbi:DUF2933 domain-containing protein [Pseudanabaena sp. PCC 6802]|uniref:DUF2933 domain-containing protein n=1 Tax=Pseudanabaena sp. PCC 6802 TaxID=118173 RepID=UPI000347FCA7